MSETTINIGPTGCGWTGRAHSRSYRSVPVYFRDVGIKPRVVAVADGVPERVTLALDNFGYESGEPNWPVLVQGDDIDVIDMAAPNALNQQIGSEDLKLIEALESLKSVAAGKLHAPGFGDALVATSVGNAIAPSWDSPRWEDVVSLRVD